MVGLKLLGILVVAAGVAGIAAWLLSREGYLPGDAMVREWEAPADAKAAEYGNGSWVSGDVAVRSRFDALTGFDLESGDERWEFVPPGRAEICAADAHEAAGIAVVAYGELSPEGAEGCVHGAAVDLRNGRTLWQEPLAGKGRSPAGKDREPRYVDVAAGGGELAALQAGGAVRALDARTGEPRWRADMPDGCTAQVTKASARQVLSVVACGDELRLAAFAAADGAELWTVPLDRRGITTYWAPTIRSADPPVVQIGEVSGIGEGVFFSFSSEGRPLARIDSPGEHGEIDLEGERAQVRVAGGRLFAVMQHPDLASPYTRVVAFDLADGRKLWHKTFKMYEINGLHATDDRVSVVFSPQRTKGAAEDLQVFDAESGDERDRRSFRDDVDLDREFVQGVHVQGDMLVVARWGTGGRPLSAFRTW